MNQKKLSIILLVAFFAACSSDESFVDDIKDTMEDIQVISDVKIEDAVSLDVVFDEGPETINDVAAEDFLDVGEIGQDVFTDARDDVLEDYEWYEDISNDVFQDVEIIDTENFDAQVIDDTGNSDAGVVENYDRYLVVSHPFGPDGSTCGRDIEFFIFSKDGILSRPNLSTDIGDCPIKVRFSPDGKFLFVLVNNSHNPQAMTQSVVVLKKGVDGRFIFFKEFSEFNGENPEYIVFKRDGTKAYVVDFNIEGEGGIHILKRENEDWVYQKEILLALPKSMVVLPDDRFAVIVGGKDPDDLAIMDLEKEEIVARFDIFTDFVDALGMDVTPDGKYIIVPNSSPYSELGNTLSIVEVDYSSDIPSLSLKSMVSNINEPSASLFTTDGSFVVVTNFSKNYTTLFKFENGNLMAQNKITSMPLADTMTMLKRGDFANYFFVNALSDIHILNIENSQLIRKQKLSLGDGNNNMLGDIDIEP